MHKPTPPAVVLAGANDTRIWGMTSATRVMRIAAASKLLRDGDSTMVADTRFAFDPQWFAYMANEPGTVLTLGGRPVLANVSAAAADAMRAAMEGEGAIDTDLKLLAYEDDVTVYNSALRKREKPFLVELTPANVRRIERESYFGAYKGVTDLLTKYLWPEWALVLTRVAARIGMTPNMVTTIGAALCVWATFLFADGNYVAGMAAGLGFMVLDTVDGKLARCTITSSWWGNIFDHGLDLVHPPFWWYAWGLGLAAHGLALSPESFWLAMGILVGGYVVQRFIEAYFIHRVGMHIHVWEKVDTEFRLITARRNPNMVILFASVLAGRPDLGLIAITVWTLLSLVFHFVRLVQAIGRRARGETLVSWLSDGAAA